MSATVVRIPVSRSQIRAAEQAVVEQLQALGLRRYTAALNGSSGVVGPVGVELSSGARLRLDPPAVPADPTVSSTNHVTLAYLAN